MEEKTMVTVQPKTDEFINKLNQMYLDVTLTVENGNIVDVKQDDKNFTLTEIQKIIEVGINNDLINLTDDVTTVTIITIDPEIFDFFHYHNEDTLNDVTTAVYKEDLIKLF